MNYCTKCSSYYQTPGTCNCYAAARPVIYPQPWYPVPTYPHPYPGLTTWIPVTGNNDCTYYAPPIVNNGALPYTSGYSHVVT